MLKIVVFKNWFQLCNHELFKLQCVIIGLHPTFVCFFTALQMQCLDKFSSTFSMSETFIIWNLISYWSQPCSVLIVTKRWCKKFAPIPILYYSCQKFAVTFCFDSKKLLLTELKEVLAVHWKNCTHPPPLLLQWTVHGFVMSRTFAPVLRGILAMKLSRVELSEEMSSQIDFPFQHRLLDKMYVSSHQCYWWCKSFDWWTVGVINTESSNQ